MRLDVCVWLWVTEGVEETDGVFVNDGEPEVEGVCVDDAVAVEDCVGEELAVGLRDDVWVCERDMKKSAMRRLFTVMEATPASLSSQAE